MKKAPVIVFLACVSMLWSCGKNPFSNGEEKEYERLLDKPFRVVEINDNVNVTLLHCDASHPEGLIHIRTCENLIDGLVTEIQEDTLHNTLVIRNDNSNEFLRPYDYAREMTIYYDSLFLININSNGCLQTDSLHGYPNWTHFTHSESDTLGYDSLVSNLHVEIQGGSGDFNVIADCFKITAKCFHGTSTLRLNGKVVEASIYGDYDCHGLIDAKELYSHNIRVNYYGTNTVIGKTFNKFTAINNNNGRIYYVRFDTVQQTWSTVQEAYIDSLYHCPLIHDFRGTNRENIKRYEGN